MRIGIFGGTFNPIHNGHINLVNKICDEIFLDKLFVFPTKTPPHKIAKNLVTEKDRFEMCKLAFEGNYLAEVSDYEINNQGKSYTIFTLRYLKEQFENAELFLFMGSDMYVTLHEWKCFEEILSLATIVVVSRSIDDKIKIKDYKPFLIEKGAKTIIIDIEPFEISSTKIREMIMQNEDCSCYLPQKVVEYIRYFNLYK